MTQKTVYIAGPDVFFPDAGAHFASITLALKEKGFIALIPSDGELSKGALPGPATAKRIFEENVVLIQRADALLVNLNAFRGTEPDSGTCFEVGLAYGLGKPIVAYVDSAEPYADRVARLCGVKPGTYAPNRFDRQEGCLIEEMGLPLNLMLACSTNLVTEGLPAAMERLETLLKT